MELFPEIPIALKRNPKVFLTTQEESGEYCWKLNGDLIFLPQLEISLIPQQHLKRNPEFPLTTGKEILTGYLISLSQCERNPEIPIAIGNEH